MHGQAYLKNPQKLGVKLQQSTKLIVKPNLDLESLRILLF